MLYSTVISDSVELTLPYNGMLLACYRSYGVLLWEIVTYGEMPLEDMGLNDIVKAATNKTLRLERYVHVCVHNNYAVLY